MIQSIGGYEFREKLEKNMLVDVECMKLQLEKRDCFSLTTIRNLLDSLNEGYALYKESIGDSSPDEANNG